MWGETLEKVRFCRREVSREAGGVHIPVQAASLAEDFAQNTGVLRKGKMMSLEVQNERTSHQLQLIKNSSQKLKWL